jgi:DNA polymerase
VDKPRTTRDSPERTRRALIQQLESLQRAGVMQLGRKRSSAGPVAPTPQAPAAPAASAPPPREATPAVRQEASEPRISAAKSAPAGGRAEQLAILRQEVAGCAACGELARTRKQTVFGVGDPHARLCFVGEAPGADEDKKGEPFVGRAGKLLDQIIAACKLSREEVYILNILKCRPPGNRNPLPTEVHSCRPFLDRQLEIIQPEFLCCLGSVAAQTLLETDTPIGRLRGKFHDYHGIPVACTYHPAYLLRNPSAKRHTWEDMKMLMRAMGVEL